ncbi:hypothetical protein VPHK453_0031 [Vibrio phage K453]
MIQQKPIKISQHSVSGRKIAPSYDLNTSTTTYRVLLVFPSCHKLCIFCSRRACQLETSIRHSSSNTTFTRSFPQSV